MIDADKYEAHLCKWCKYVEDGNAWHYEECLIFDDPMMKHHIAEVYRLQVENNKLHDAINRCGFNDVEYSCLDVLEQMEGKKNDDV